METFPGGISYKYMSLFLLISLRVFVIGLLRRVEIVTFNTIKGVQRNVQISSNGPPIRGEIYFSFSFSFLLFALKNMTNIVFTNKIIICFNLTNLYA